MTRLETLDDLRRECKGGFREVMLVVDDFVICTYRIKHEGDYFVFRDTLGKEDVIPDEDDNIYKSKLGSELERGGLWVR